MHEVILFYKGLDVPTRQILDSKGTIPTIKDADAKVAIQEIVDHFQKWHNETSTRARSTETSNGLAAIQAEPNNLGRVIRKMNEKVYATQVGYESCGRPHYTKDRPFKEEEKAFEEAYYTQFGVPFPQGGRYRTAAPGFYQRDSGNPLYQEQRKTMKESLSKFMAESTKRHDENSNLIKEIQAAMDAVIRNQGALIKNLEIQIRKMSKVLQDKGSRSLPSSTKTNPRDHALADLGAEISVMPLTTFTNLDLGELAPTKLTVDLADRTIKHPIVPLILKRPFLSTSHAKIDVFKRKITLRVRDDKITFKSVKPASSLIKRVYVLGLRERMDLDLEARLMGEELILNRSLDPEFRDFIELNDLNEPLELRRNQINYLGPTSDEREIIDEPMKNIVKTRNENEKIERINEYPSIYDYDRKIHVD
nr:hypothetical protein [Tanacetum cinerariifolium]